MALLNQIRARGQKRKLFLWLLSEHSLENDKPSTRDGATNEA